MEDLSDFFTGLFTSDNIAKGLAAATDIAGMQANVDSLRQLPSQLENTALGLAEKASEQAAFVPYTITSDPMLGSASVDSSGNINLATSPTQQAMTSTALQGAQDVLGGLVQGTDARQQAIYDQMLAARAPELERQRQIEQQQMAAQGRLGLGSALYGMGSPEEYARQQAMLDQQSRDWLSAQTAAQSELTSQQNLLGALTGQAYQPQQQMLNALNATTGLQQLKQSGLMSGAEAYSGVINPLLESVINAETTATNTEQKYYDMLQGLLAPTSAAALQEGATASLGQQLGTTITEGFDSLYNSIFGED